MPEGYDNESTKEQAVDLEKGVVDVQNTLQELSSDPQREVSPQPLDEGKMGPVGKALAPAKRAYHRYLRKWWPVFWGCFFTAWWLLIVIQDKHRHRWLIPTVLWGAIMLRVITLYIPVLHWCLYGARAVWTRAADVVYTTLLPSHTMRTLAAAVITVGVMLLGTFVPSATQYLTRADRAQSMFGVIVALALLYLTLMNPRAIRWHTVIGGMLMQYIVALFVLQTKAGYDIFEFILTLARELLGFARDGVAFLTNTNVSQLGMFFFTVLPLVIFFVAFIHIWYYFGVIQWVVGKAAYLFYWLLRVLGAEAVNAAAAPFLGIGELAILIKNLLPYLTDAEIHQIMCLGFATILGLVLALYISMGVNPQALISSCVMLIPALLAVSKLRFPETEKPVLTGKIEVPDMDDEDPAKKPQNVLQAFLNGATLGIIIAATILTQIMCIIALVALINGLLTWFGKFWNIHELTLQLMAKYLLYPVAWLLGTPKDEVLIVLELLAVKFIQNEFQGYNMLRTELPYMDMSKRGRMIATYALCGFANFGSVGTQVGVLSTLAPSKLRPIARLVVLALITGGISTLLSAAVASMVMHDLGNYNL